MLVFLMIILEFQQNNIIGYGKNTYRVKFTMFHTIE